MFLLPCLFRHNDTNFEPYFKANLVCGLMLHSLADFAPTLEFMRTVNPATD